ncbi:hypothetical protein [Crossiella cryophila]|uniref:Uncharacterized protein n=1 Tax=Crossiella cryophila TaxID=43355 RepID=A0A7W7C8N8_9PSEU|nr:hypothetical protein [Crossiella cryophila]MBB4676555.1 hypothetical protein [Crossiella cryophila]
MPLLIAVGAGGAAMLGINLWPSDTPRPEGIRGDQIYKWFQEGKGPGSGISPIQSAWDKVGKGYDEARDLAEKVLRDSHGVWEGKAADAARQQLSPLAAFADHAKQMAGNTAKAVGQQGTDWHGCKNQLKPVPENPPQNNLGNKLNPFTTDLDREIDKFKTDTGDNQRVYAGYGVRTEDNVKSLPTWLTPPEVSGDVSVVKPGPGGPGGPGGGGGFEGGRGGGGGLGGGLGQFGGGGGGYSGGAGGGGAGGGGTGGGGGGGSAEVPVVGTGPAYPPRDQTGSAGYVSNEVPISGGGAGGGPGGGGGYSGGAGGGGFGGAVPGGFGPGGGAGGGLGAGGSAGVGRAGGAGFGPAGGGVAGRPGASGMGGMPMGGAGAGRKEEDEEHERASFLMETEDIFGDHRSVAPPVIGE